MAHTLIIHGWSDCSGSFKDMKARLQDYEIGTVDTIFYGDYESREDNITFNDVVDGLNEQMIERGLINSDGTRKTDLNIIVHSTGGLVIRHWIWRYYCDRIEECPIKRIVMLAPANFGSPLAHRGKSFLGNLVKGRWKIGDFLEVGRRLLDGLELASPYQWQLAHHDLFSAEKSWFNKDQIQLTIMTGIEDYAGIRGWVNKPGTDGTVVISGTSLDSIKLTLDFCDPKTPYEWTETKTAHDFCFGVLAGLDHGTIVSDFEKERGRIIDLTTEALKTDTAQKFTAFKNKLKNITDATYGAYAGKNDDKYSRYQQFLIKAMDDHDAPVRDYTIEFYVYKAGKAENNLVHSNRYFNKTEADLSEKFHKVLIREIHTHSKDTSYRRLLVNLDKLNKLIDEAKERLGPFVISMKLFVPNVDAGIFYEPEALQNVVIYHSDTENNKGIPKLFFHNTTTLLELKVNRKTSYVRIGKEPK
ncbi:MAG: hypothetical protein WEA56_00750 [Balneolaceae bacterium]